MRVLRVVLVAAAVAAFGVGCGTEAKKDGASPPIAWHACAEKQWGAAVQCADIEVPLDWDKPDGDKITVGINRLPASDSARRIGAVVFEPGGPGGAGSTMVAAESMFSGVFPAEVRARFDLIGFDPRGVGTSKPAVRCDPELANRRPDAFVADQAGYDALVAANKAFGASCQKLTGPLLDHLDSVAVARDLEVVRQRLDAGPLNYIGLSYGTEIGFEYARLFPANSRALVLDGALVHSLPPSAMHVYETAAFENSIRRFAEWCRATADCALGGDDAAAVVRDLAASARRAPLPAPECAASKACAPEVRPAELLHNIQGSLLFKAPIGKLAPGWADLATALDRARKGDASELSPRTMTETRAAGLAAACTEFRADFAGYPGFKAQQLLTAALAPNTLGGNETFGYLAQCEGWPAAFSNPPHTATVRPTITPLIIGATNDPSTAYGWAQLMATQMPNAVLLTREGDGHTSFLIPGQTSRAIVDYLIDGTVPAAGTVLPD
ncbi:alpha/beta hydrolase [Nocardia panacis]|nr:alpha/beta hydrolase [Nocardia panacis]